ncbi:AI-2E family transporter [Kribbella jiaozuonensis]|uniref:AI-2E family transporter n=1 Tax=Kribbella jiaozuonensis TaxID=2575441 RepID=A0A4V5UXS6_9ACTN|nr:AI-2E family transporter [Kribbella jiaozuonensis]TKK76203.1 AI-2E family transporter [Kribbella jiaozuonensis]
MSADSTQPPDVPSPSTLPRGVVVLLGTAAAILTAAGLRGFADIAGPVFLALILTIAVSPLRRLLVRQGLKVWIASLIALVVVNAFLLGMAAALALSVAKLATLLPTYQERFADLVDDVRGWLADRGIGDEQIQAALQKVDLGKFFDVLQGWLSGLLGVVSNLGFIIIVLFFMGLDASAFSERLREAARIRPDISSALTGFARGTTRYLVVSTVFGLIVAIFDVGVLYLLDIPLPWLWGLLAFITNYIPNVGFFIGVIPPALLGLLDQGWATLLWVIIAYSVINFIIQSIIQPKVVGEAVGLSTTLTFLSLVFWAWILGPLGAVLAIPLSLLVKALLLDADPSTRWLGGLISGDQLPEDAPPAEEEAAAADLPPTEVATEQVG